MREEKFRDPDFLKILRRMLSKRGDEPIELGGKAFTIDEFFDNIEQNTENGRMIIRILLERMKPSTDKQTKTKLSAFRVFVELQ